MSLTSCYRYILELPVDTLNLMLRAALSENDSADISIAQHWENVPIGDYTATVDARPTDLDTNPPSIELTATDLELVLSQIHMRLEVDINEIEALDTIVYTIVFDLPGVFEKDTSIPPKLLINFPGVTTADLNLSVSGGDIPLTPELIEPTIHELYDADPSLGYDHQTGVYIPILGEVNIITEIYDDDPTSPDFRGAITVEVSDDASQITIVMPGHFRVFGISEEHINTDMTVRVTVGIEKDDAAGKICAKLSTVQSSDVAVTFDTTSPYDLAVIPILQAAIADKINGDETPDPDKCVDIPTEAEITDMISLQIVDFSTNLRIPIFTPSEPAAGEIDLTTFVPRTINQEVLALQIVPLEDGTPCDTPDVFAKTTGFSVAIAAVEVTPMVESILAANRGHQSLEGYDMTVDPLTGTLSDPGDNGTTNGHIWIEGTAEVEVDCWADPEVDFWGPIYLIPATGPDGTIVFTADAGNFGADDPCCADVDPSDIAGLIEGEQSAPIALPTNFTDVGELNLTVDEAEIFRAGIVVHGSMTVTTLSALHASAIRKTLYWFNEMPGGG